MKKDQRLVIYITKELENKLEELRVKETRQTIADTVRSILIRYLSEKEVE